MAVRRASARLSGESNDADMPPVAVLKGQMKVNGAVGTGLKRQGGVVAVGAMGEDGTEAKKRKLAGKRPPSFKPPPTAQPHSSQTPPDAEDESFMIPPPPPSERKIARQRPSMRPAASIPLSPESPPRPKQRTAGAQSSKPLSRDMAGSTMGGSGPASGASAPAPKRIDFLNLTSAPRARPSMPRPQSPPRALSQPTSYSAPSRSSASVSASAAHGSTASSRGAVAAGEPFVRKTRKSMGRLGMPLPSDVSGETEVPVPESETPMIRKNKQLREDQSRRSSLGMRGQRASSSLGRGELSMPHPSVDPAQYYTHIAPTMPEPIRARHLLVYCAKRATDNHIAAGSGSRDKGKDKRSKEKEKGQEAGPRTEEGDRLVGEIMEAFMVGLGKGEVETNVFSMMSAPGGSGLRAHPQNASNRKEEEKAEAVIKRKKEEKQAWTSLKNRANRRQKQVIATLRAKDATADKPDMAGMPEWMVQALEVADGVIAQGKGVLEAKGEFADVEYKVDLLHQSTHVALQYSMQATRFLDGVFATLSSDLQTREPRKTRAGESDGPDPVKLLSSATGSSVAASSARASGSKSKTTKSDPIHILRALAAADSRQNKDEPVAAAHRLQPVTAGPSVGGVAVGLGASTGPSAAQTPRRAAPTPRRGGGAGPSTVGPGAGTAGTGGVRGRMYGRGTAQAGGGE